jgi:hypothetical protein
LTTSDPNLGLLLKIRKKLLPTGNTADQTEGGRENLLGMHRPLSVLGLGGGGALATEGIRRQSRKRPMMPMPALDQSTEQEVLDGGDPEAEQDVVDAENLDVVVGVGLEEPWNRRTERGR